MGWGFPVSRAVALRDGGSIGVACVSRGLDAGGASRRLRTCRSRPDRRRCVLRQPVLITLVAALGYTARAEGELSGRPGRAAADRPASAVFQRDRSVSGRCRHRCGRTGWINIQAGRMKAVMSGALALCVRHSPQESITKALCRLAPSVAAKHGASPGHGRVDVSPAPGLCCMDSWGIEMVIAAR